MMVAVLLTLLVGAGVMSQKEEPVNTVNMADNWHIKNLASKENVLPKLHVTMIKHCYNADGIHYANLDVDYGDEVIVPLIKGYPIYTNMLEEDCK